VVVPFAGHMPSFGAIKSLQNRVGGAPRAICKKALEDHEDDEDAAAKHISETTEFKDTKAPSERVSDPLKNLCLADHEAGRPVLEEVVENTKVSIIRIEEGDRATYPGYGDTLRVHYTGTLDDGTVFDSSMARGKPFDFKVGKKQVIAGWDEALMKMSLGERAIVLVPAAKAYGAQGAPPAVPPHADLKFEIHLMNITRQTSCLGAGKHGGVQKESHEYKELADQLLGRAPPTTVVHNLPDDRQPMPLTADMPKVDMLREHS
jgi:FK506-binding protein 1